ncbi:hypothetical protein BT63DRAFT_13476 [Microthyrium microscopicum]|uniref:FHA domain-containing protein n=1 Tax=Microthyrium microscopicum TaxID=703497 RepID=A0A6A6UT09_9PEZI|nr:hypothetical protein BT63DRAFT_13476 [Microthyrium microscopicum]
MTAVAPPPNFQNLNTRSAWGSSNPPPNGIPAMSADEVSRMLMQPRKTATRSNSSSSLSSVASSTSTASVSSTGSVPQNSASSADSQARKRPSRYQWPMAKAEPTAGISTARTQSMTSSSGPSAASAISALQAPGPVLNQNQSISQTNGVRSTVNETTPVLYLTPMNGTFERKTITVPFFPDVIKIGRQTNAKSLPTQYNGYFDSKVLSRSHAEVWADRNGKIWIRDIKSSNGTFVNGHRLSQENKDSDPHELRDQDMLELGIDIVSEDQKTVVHHKVAARVEHAGFMSSNALIDLNIGSEMDPNSHQAQMMQAMGHMRRKSGQSDLMPMRNQMSNVPGSIPNNAPPQRPPFFLQPPNMDAVIKRLTVEYKLAQQQATELQRSSQFLDSLLNATQPPPSKEPSLPAPGGPGSPVDSRKPPVSFTDPPLKPRFCDPPNPPPQAPLPEKPELSGNLSGLKRSDTERPKLPNGSSSGSLRLDSNTVSQFASLSEALALTKKELESQSRRCREMEDLLVLERTKREDAEARARQLEQNTSKANGPPNLTGSEGVTTPIEDEASSDVGNKVSTETTTDKLKQRLDLLLVEFQEVKEMAEKWRLEKENAEKERDEERKEKVGLMEMVQKLRKEEQDRQERKERKRETQKRDGRAISQFDSSTEDEADQVANHSREIDYSDHNNETIKPKSVSYSNGHLSHSFLPRTGDGGTTMKHAQGQLVQAAPYLSAMSVVLIGVAVMALVNKMSRGER